MADYKRMVSYMYQYENGVKRRNVGFAKVEAKGGLCKFTIHMQLLGQLDSIFPTYLIQRNKGNLELIYLGDAVLKNQVMDSKLTAEENNIMGTGFRLSDMGGILLFLHDNIFFATEWDDKPVVAEEVLAALRPKKEKTIASKEPSLKKKSEAIKPPEVIKTPEVVLEPITPIEPTPYYNQYTAMPDVEFRNNVQPGVESEKQQDIPAVEAANNQMPINPASEPQIFTSRLTLEDELRIPKYKLPGGIKMIERLQESYSAAIVTPAQLQEEQKDLSNEMKRAIDISTEGHKTSKEVVIDETEEEIYNTTDNNSDIDEVYESAVNQTQTLYKEGYVIDENTIDESADNVSGEENSVSYEADENDEDIGEQEDNLQDPLTAQQIFSNYPRIYPFEDNEVLLCVKVEPKDINLLPKEVWPYSNNSFLMHGYYCYHHLIFAKMKNRYGSRYILGVPGIYHNREQFMAKMFGFENFKSMKKRELKQGDFGYWFLPVNFVD